MDRMDVLSAGWLKSFWAGPQLAVNTVIFLNLLGALLLGLVVGYERSYHGRAAGMRTYGIVCMASAALVALAGFPAQWYGGGGGTIPSADPTRLVQGIVTGVGFLGAGVVLREGPNIRGLTTAASIWASSAIGVLVGVGFDGAAIFLTVRSSTLMMWGRRVEERLPCRAGLAVVVRFLPGATPKQDSFSRIARDRGYEFVTDSLAISYEAGRAEWRFIAVAADRHVASPISDLARELAEFEGIEHFQLTPARN